jgi:hypothetical protein
MRHLFIRDSITTCRGCGVRPNLSITGFKSSILSKNFARGYSFCEGFKFSSVLGLDPGSTGARSMGYARSRENWLDRPWCGYTGSRKGGQAGPV